ncbi:MAG: spore cortex biosynthesis protein YabQ [Clostridia bacterium]|nr:spore cortex biosynthesis protein YabQ [Clostridia bacterium]
MTFDAEFHFYYAIILCAYGISTGFLYDLFYFFELFVKSKIFQAVLDILFWAFSFLIFFYVNQKYKFSSQRFYFLLSFLGGFWLQHKSFHKILAIFAEKVYNKVNKILFKLKNNINIFFNKRKNNGRKKSKKHIDGVSIVGGTTANRFGKRTSLPIRFNGENSRKNKRLKARN